MLNVISCGLLKNGIKSIPIENVLNLLSFEPAHEIMVLSHRRPAKARRSHTFEIWK